MGQTLQIIVGILSPAGRPGLGRRCRRHGFHRGAVRQLRDDLEALGVAMEPQDNNGFWIGCLASAFNQHLSTRFIRLAQRPSGPVAPVDPRHLDAIMVRAQARGRSVQQYLAERAWINSRQLYR